MSTYFSIRCDGPGCEAESHRRLSSPDLAIPGAWQVLKLGQGKDAPHDAPGIIEDLHFCSMSCLARWAEQDPAQTATVPVMVAATTLPASDDEAAAAAPTEDVNQAR